MFQKYLKKFFILFIIVIVTIYNIQIPNANAKTLGDLKKELQQFIDDYEKNKHDKELSKQEIANIETKIANINNNIINLGNEIIDLDEEIEVLTADIESKKTEIEDLLIFVQISSGEKSYLEYIFGAKDFTDFIYRTAVSEELVLYNNQLMESYENSIRENEAKKEELNLKKIELQEQQQNLKVELDKVRGVLSDLDKLSLSIEDEIAARKSEIKIYEDKGCKDNEDIRTCGRDKLPKDTVFYRPLKQGYLTAWYGSRNCSDPRVSCYHMGLDMSASGANYGNVPVYSIANGVVVYVTGPSYNSSTGRYNTLCGGNKVYIQHNVNGVIYTSGYLHLRKIMVSIGDTVTKETQIGIVGGQPSVEYWDNCSTGAHLHLELSTGTFNNGTYYSNRFAANSKINFPKGLYGPVWYDRTTKF